MGVQYNSRIVTDSLVLAFDAANPKNYNLTAVEVLVVAGGGGGGTGGGGGGAGGLIYNSNFAVTPGSALTVTVGNGGAGASGWGSAGQQGGNSVFGSLTAIGGGAGLHRAGATNSGTGGSGGGDAGGSGYTLSNATAGQGFSGGNSPKNGSTLEEPGGGGGGAGGPGENASTPTSSDNTTVRATAAGAGGPGLGFDISGTFTYYAGGGGGSNRNGVGKPGGIGGGGTGGASPTAGTPNTGGGGGGTGYSGYGGGGTSAAGGSGIVIVRYPGHQRAIGGTVSSVGGYTIHTFTTVETTSFTPLVATNNSTIFGLADFSGNNKFSTSANEPRYTNSNLGGINFDGSNEKLSLSASYASPSLPIGSSPRTLIACFKPTTLGGYRHVIHYGSNSINQAYGIALLDNYINNHTWGGNSYFTNFGVTTNQIYWVAVTYNDSSSPRNTFFVNGTFGTTGYGQGKTADYTLNTGTSYDLVFGSRIADAEYFVGDIYFTQIYNKALTPQEIQQNFNALRGRFGI